MKKTLFTLLAFLTLGGIAYAQFPQAYKPYSYPVGNGTFNLQGTSSPTFGIITATSTTATSTIYGNLKIGTSAQGTSSPFQITATSTPATPASASASIVYNSGSYSANGAYNLITYWVYPYRVINGVKIFSATPAKTATTSDDNSHRLFKINVSWSAVPDVVGYRVMIYDEDIEGAGTNPARNPYCDVSGDCGVAGSRFRYIYKDTTSTSLTDDGVATFTASDGIGFNKATLIGPTQSGSDLYVEQNTGDLYSPNGGYFGKTAVGTVTVYRKNRQVVYYNATGTDAYSYGIALTQAVDSSNIQAGDLIVTKSGTFQLNHLLLADGVCLVGQGMENTILTGDNPSAGVRYTSPNGGYDFINFPASAYSGCIKDLTINIQDLSKNSGIPIEITGPDGNTASSTFLFQNINILAEADGIFPFNANNNDMVIDMINVHCHTKWDCFNSTSITQKTTINLHDSTLICKGPDTSTTNGQGCSPWATRSTAQPLLTENLYNSLLWAQGGGVQHDVAVSFQAYTGHFNLYNTELRTDATSTTDVASHIILYGGANPTITSYHSYFDPSKITNELGVKTGTTVYGSTLSTTTGMYINGNLGIRTTSTTYDLSVNGLSQFSTTTLNACSAEADSTEGVIYSGCNSALGPFQIISNRLDDWGGALDSVWGGYGDNGTGVRHGNWITAGTTTFNGPVIVAPTHAVSNQFQVGTTSALDLVVTNGRNVGIGTSTTFSNDKFTISSAQQGLTFTDGTLTSPQFNFRVSSTTLYLATSSAATGATSTLPLLKAQDAGFTSIALGTTTQNPLTTAILYADFNPGTASSTVNLRGKSQFTITDAGGTVRCAFWDFSGAFTTITGKCND